MIPSILEVAFLAYLLGSIPFGYLVGRLKGLDIRQHGSGNIGATNVLRVLGKPLGFTVFALDALKGFLAVGLSFWIANRQPDTAVYSDSFAIFAAAFCVAGHSFPIWLGFQGGKGVATSAGALIGIIPAAALAILIIWVVLFFATRYVSLSSIIAAATLPMFVGVLLWLGRLQTPVLLYFSIVMAALVIWRHRSNITRLLNGTEPRFTKK